MKKHPVNLDNINWPDKCAYCNEEASSSVQVKSTALKKVGYFIFFLLTSSRVIKITFPVCKKHKVKAMLASKLSQRSQLYIALGVFSVLFVLAPIGDLYRLINGVKQPEVAIGWNVFLYCYPIIYWAIFFWAKNNAPIIIEDSKNEINFCFKNDEFAYSFIKLNQASS